jgi:hypothetical protein
MFHHFPVPAPNICSDLKKEVLIRLFSDSQYCTLSVRSARIHCQVVVLQMARFPGCVVLLTSLAECMGTPNFEVSISLSINRSLSSLIHRRRYLDGDTAWSKYNDEFHAGTGVRLPVGDQAVGLVVQIELQPTVTLQKDQVEV